MILNFFLLQQCGVTVANHILEVLDMYHHKKHIKFQSIFTYSITVQENGSPRDFLITEYNS